MQSVDKASSIKIHKLHELAQLKPVEQLQREVWGDIGVIPAMEMVAVAAAGGCILGAFDDHEMIGFSYGFPGYEHGEVSLHSHMTAVVEKYRDFSVGHKLKLVQKARTLARGIHRITWTFDPLQSRNAHFNFHKLGVICDRYFVNFYGEDTVLFLEGVGTDRFWVTWRLDENPAAIPAKLEVEPLVSMNGAGEPVRSSRPFSGLYQLIEIPADVNELQKHHPDYIRPWREATRWAFVEALKAGYVIVGFQGPRERGHHAGAYVLHSPNTR